MSKISIDRLQSSGHAKVHGDQLLCLPDAGHLIGTPGWSTTDSYAYPHSALGGALMVLGGTPAGTAHASREADDAIRALLAGLASAPAAP